MSIRAVIVGLLGGAVLVAVLWWIGFGEPEVEDDFIAGVSSEETTDEQDDTSAALEGRAIIKEEPEVVVERTGTAVVRAQVVDTTGKPLGGIPVELREIKRNDRFNWRPSKHASDQFKPPVDTPLIDTKPSQSDGWIEYRGLDVTRGYQLRAKPDAPYYGSQVTVWPGRSQSPPVLVLGEGVPLKVRVVNGSGEGTKAWVSASVLSEADHRGWNQLITWHLPRTVTGGDGRLALAAVPETPLNFSVFVPGQGSRTGIEVVPPFDKEVVLAFEHSGGPVIHGTVTDSSGQPVPKARLIANLNPGGAAGWHSRYTRVTESGADGRYRIEGLPAGFLTGLSVHADGYIYMRSVAPPMDLADGQEVAVDVKLYRGGVLEGTVRDPEGNAISGARVISTKPAQHYWNSRGTTAVTDENGRFQITDVPLGKGQVGAYAEGFYMPAPEGVKVKSWQAPPGVLFEVKEEGERLSRDITLVAGVRVVGTVLDPDDKPIVGARVWAWGNLQQRISMFDQYATQRVSDAEGRFEYAGLIPGDTWRFSAGTADGRAKQVNVMVSKDKEPEPVKLVLKPLGGIRGRVDAGSRKLTRPVGVQIRRKQGGGSWTVTSRADGSFEQRGLAAGTYELYASDGLGRRVGTSVSVEVVDGAFAEDVTIAVEALGHVLGRVEDLDGKPLSGVKVTLRYKRSGNRYNSTSTTTRAGGRFAWRDLLDGDYEVKIAGDKTWYHVRPGEDEQKYLHVVPPKDIVEGTVTGPNGQPVASGSVSIRRVRKPGSWNGSNAQIVNGRFRGEAPKGDGHIDISVSYVMDAFGRKLNTLPYLYEGWTITTGPLDIKLEAGHRISGRVIDPSGKGVPHVGIHIQNERRDGRRWYGYYYNHYHTNVRTDEEGRFEHIGLKEGRYEVYAQPGDAWMQPEPVSADAGDENVVVALQRGLAISGRVVDDAGGGVAGVSLQYSWPVKDGYNNTRTMNRSAKSDANGAFEITGLPMDARGTLYANPPSSKDKSYIRKQESNISSGESGLVVSLTAGGYIEGRVQGPVGEPLSRMRVRADINNNGRWVSKYSGRTKADGTFKIGPVAPGLFRMRVDARGEYSKSEPLETHGPISDLVLEVPRGEPVRGTVTGENIKGFQATWYYRNSKGGWSSKRGSVQSSGKFFVNQPNDAAGTLLIRRNGDSRYALLEDVRPSDGPFEIELSEGHSIRGYVDGLPEKWRWGNVYARNNRGMSLWGRLSRDGTFEIRGVPEGTYTISAHVNPGRIGAKQNVEAGADNVQLFYSR